MIRRPLILLLILFILVGCVNNGGDGDESVFDSQSDAPTQSLDVSSDASRSSAGHPKDYGAVLFGVEGFSYYELAEDPGGVAGWFESASQRGISVVGIDMMDIGDGTIGFDSPTLRAAGFKEDPDYGNIFPEILREAKKQDIKVTVMLEGMAHVITGFMEHSDNIKADALTTTAVEKVIKDLGAAARAEGVEIGVSEEAYPEEYIDTISKVTKETGIEYTHFFEDLSCRSDLFLSEDYAYYPFDAKNSVEDQDYLRHLLQIGSYYGEIGNLNVMYGAARGCGIEAGTLTAGGWGMGAKTHQNIALLRSVQYGPRQFYFVIGEGADGSTLPGEEEYVVNYDFDTRLLPLVEEFGRKETDIRKPIANIIIDEPGGGEDLLDFFTNAQISSMGAITNAMLAAGYDIVVTKAKPLDGAKLYYVFSPGIIFGEGKDLPPELAELIDGDAPVFYQVAGELADAPNWNRVKRGLGLGKDIKTIVNEDDTSFFDPIPEEVIYEFPAGKSRVKYGGISLEVWSPEQAGRFSLGHYLHYIKPGNVEGETLVVGKTSRDEDGLFDDETALIVRKGNAFFVNGGYLHLDASSVLANIMSELAGKGPIYNKPSYGYFTNGKDRAVFYAPYNVDVDVNVFGGSQVTEFDEEGNRLTGSGLALVDGRLRGSLERFHLIVID